MKLVLSDGTVMGISDYCGKYISLNGENLEAVAITVKNSNLETIKSTFKSGENLAIMHIYTNENVLKETLVGYAVRKSIELGEDDQTFTITIAKTSDTLMKLKAMETAVEEMTNIMKTTTVRNDEIAEELNGIKSSFDQALGAATSIEEMREQIEKITTGVNNAIDKVNEQTTIVGDMQTKVKDAMSEFSGTKERLDRMKETLLDAEKKSADALNYADTANNTMAANKTKLENIDRSFNEARNGVNEALTTVMELSNDVAGKINAVGEAIKTVTEVKTQVEDFMSVPDIETLPLAEAKLVRVEESCRLLEEYLLTHPITSSCHGGVPAQYSITEKKQTYLQAMIMMTNAAEQNGIEYQPSWNATGEACTYDWTVGELQMLAVEIEAVVRPLVSHQQMIEKEIMEASSMAQLLAVEISYDGISPNEINVKNVEPEE